MSDEAEYLDYLDRMMGVEPAHYPITDADVSPPIYVASYVGAPDALHTSSFTVGLSSAPPPSEVGIAVIELSISVRSRDTVWAFALGEVARQARGQHSFDVGDTINFGCPMSAESAMSGFLVIEPLLFDPRASLVHCTGRHILIRQLCPLYAEELRAIRERGVDWFASSSPVVSDISRANLARS